MVLSYATKVVRALSDVTVGTVIVLAHVALAEREHARRLEPQAPPRHRLRA